MSLAGVLLDMLSSVDPCDGDATKRFDGKVVNPHFCSCSGIVALHLFSL